MRCYIILRNSDGLAVASLQLRYPSRPTRAHKGNRPFRVPASRRVGPRGEVFLDLRLPKNSVPWFGVMASFGRCSMPLDYATLERNLGSAERHRRSLKQQAGLQGF